MNQSIKTIVLATVVGVAANSVAGEQPSNAGAAKNVVLVHGAFADGSGWRGVYDELTSRG